MPMPDELFGPLFGDDEVDAAVSDTAMVRQMLAVEAALGLSCADAGLVPGDAAHHLADACSSFIADLPAIASGAKETGNPVVALLAQLRAGLATDAANALHLGATSQDIIDSSLMLVTRDAFRRILQLLEQATLAAASLADEYRATLRIAHTLGRQAAPTTFGLTAAGWLRQLNIAAERLTARLEGGLPVQLGGAVGTQAAYGDQGPAVAAALAGRLALAAPAAPWHTNRQPVLDVAHALSGVVVAAAKVASDVLALSADEVREIRIRGGGSSAMPHKENPVSAVLIRSAAIRMPGLVATLLAAAVHDQERATGAWHAEWPAWRDLLRVTGGAVARLVALFAELEIAPAQMAAQLESTGGLLMGEAVSGRLTPLLGRDVAHRVVAELARRSIDNDTAFDSEVRRSPQVNRQLDAQAIDESLDPAAWLGSADAQIDSALAAHRRRTEEAR
jgi:3-carboxy-cis,cis-muconate cycloisomerase